MNSFVELGKHSVNNGLVSNWGFIGSFVFFRTSPVLGVTRGSSRTARVLRDERGVCGRMRTLPRQKEAVDEAPVSHGEFGSVGVKATKSMVMMTEALD